MTSAPERVRLRVERDPTGVAPADLRRALEADPRDATAVGEALVALDGEERRDAAAAAVAGRLDTDAVAVRRGAALALAVCFDERPTAGADLADALAAALTDGDHVVRKHAGTALRDVALSHPPAAVAAADDLHGLLLPDRPDLLSAGLDVARVVVEADPDVAVTLLDPLLDALCGLADRDVDVAAAVDRPETVTDGAREHQRQYATEVRRQRGAAADVVATVVVARPEAAEGVIDRLVAALERDGVGVERATLAEAVGRVAENHPDAVVPAVDALAGLLGDDDPTVAATAAWALGTLAESRGERVAHATAGRVDALADLLATETTGARVASAGLLAYVGEHRPSAAAAATDALAERLDDDDPDVRASAAVALGHAGAERALSDLRALTETDPDETVRATAESAVERIGNPD